MRIARQTHPGLVHHIISQFVDDSWFFQQDEERERYLWFLGRALAKTDWLCLAYALMSNHLHFALLPGRRPLESWTKATNSPFARWMNERYGRRGPIFADRPASHAKSPRDEADVIAYIHNNPVAAGVVARASDSTWTSHRAFLGLTPRPRWLHVETALEICGFTDSRAFDSWVASSTELQLEYPEMAEVRKVARRRGAIELGTPLDQQVMLVRRHESLVRPDPSEIVALVVELAGVDIGIVCSRTMRPRGVSARRVALHVAVRFGLTISDMTARLGISPQAGSRLSREPLNGEEIALRDAVEAAGISGRFVTTMVR